MTTEPRVEWERPGDERLHWQRDAMHFPDPVAPLTADLGMSAGQCHAAEAYAMPIRFRGQRLHGYWYGATPPVVHTPQEMAELGPETERRMGAAMAGLLQRWDAEWHPELVGHLTHLEGVAVDGADRAALRGHVRDAVERIHRIWEIHFLVVFPAHLATSLFADLYVELFPGSNEIDADRLIRTRRHKLVEADLALWRLGRLARGQEAVRAALAAERPADALAGLQASDAGRAFLEALRAHLDAYGRRADRFDVGAPTWLEDPAPVLQRLRAQLAQPERDLEADVAAREAAGEEAVAAARRRLGGYPRPVVARFEELLRMATEAAFLQEEHNFWIDLRGVSAFRGVLVRVGARLVAMGALEEAGDVVHLRMAELLEALDASTVPDLRPLVALRKEEMARAARSTPPPVLGTPPSGPPPASPMGRSMGRFFGAPVAASGEPGVVRGHAGAPGVVRGTARVIRTLDEADRLGHGEVLVAPTTITSWSPLFATAAAVVTDTGGMLSHCAVVAREYGIPAVVGTGTATRVLRDGQVVEVDGSNGRVTVVGDR